MAYLYQLFIVINEDEEDLQLENNIEKKVQEVFLEDMEIEIVGAKISELDNAVCGNCYKCGAWTSDQDAPEHIEGFSDGILEDGKWLCDLCLPPEHPKAF